MFNKNKLKLLELENKIAEKDAEIASLKDRLNGERYCSQLCQNCVHAVKDNSFLAVRYPGNQYLCELDNKCRDFEKIKTEK